jgi:hypothetical protein
MARTMLGVCALVIPLVILGVQSFDQHPNA